EDGIRDFHVTGVQTCALPISSNQHIFGAHLVDFEVTPYYSVKHRKIDTEVEGLRTFPLQCGIRHLVGIELRRIGGNAVNDHHKFPGGKPGKRVIAVYAPASIEAVR